MRHTILTSFGVILAVGLNANAGDAAPKPLLELNMRASAVALAGDDNSLAIADVEQGVRLLHRSDGKLLGEMGKLSVPVGALAFSPDGELLAAAGVSPKRPGSFELRLWSIDDKSVVYEVTEPNHRDGGDGAEAIAFLRFSPDGKLLVHPTKNRTVVAYDLDKRKARHSFRIGLVPSAIAFSPSGKTLVVGTDTAGSHGALYHVDLETGTGLPCKAMLYSGVLDLAFSADGQHVWGGHRDWLYRLDTKTGNYEAIVADHWNPAALSFSPEADRVGLLNGKELQLRETKSGKPLSRWSLGSGALAWSPDGRAIVTATEDGKVRVWDVSPAAVAEQDVIRVMRQNATHEFDLDGNGKEVAHQARRGIASPDGKQIVYEHQDNDAVRLFIAQADGSQQQKLTKEEGKEFSPCWSPDGERIVFVSDSSGNLQIHAVNVDGSNHEQLTAHELGAALPKFGRDGSLAYLMWREPLGKGRRSDLVVMQGKKSKTIVSKQNVSEYAWSPEGKSLAIGKMGELMFHDIETGREKSIAFKAINPGFDHHAARCLTWNPAGDAVVCRIEATGGRQAGGPVLAGDDEVFIVPRNGKARSFSVGKTRAETPRPAGAFPRSLTVIELQWVRR